jgi:hypothetical protein
MSGARRQVDERVAEAGRSVRDTLAETVTVARSLERAYDEALEPFDLTFEQYQVLDLLRTAGPRGVAADRFRSRLHHLCVAADCAKHLERQGLIERTRGGARTITGVGRRRMAMLDVALEELEDRLTKRVGFLELERARITLGKLHLEEDELE